jgi:hypothetical protein
MISSVVLKRTTLFVLCIQLPKDLFWVKASLLIFCCVTLAGGSQPGTIQHYISNCFTERIKSRATSKAATSTSSSTASFMHFFLIKLCLAFELDLNLLCD